MLYELPSEQSWVQDPVLNKRLPLPPSSKPIRFRFSRKKNMFSKLIISSTTDINNLTVILHITGHNSNYKCCLKTISHYCKTIRMPEPHLTRIKPERGEISFLKAVPICAPANGNLPWLKSRSRLKFTKIPCAVSGRRNLQH